MRIQAAKKQKQGKIFVISGPSGSGKTTLAESLLKVKEFKGLLVKPASFTTRAKRSKEKSGEHYFFISEKVFKEKLTAKKILEWTRYLGYYYATSRELVEKELAAGRNIVLCLDLKGALAIKKIYPKKTVTIFVLPPSLEALKERIEGRCHKTGEKEICRRLDLARQELKDCDKYDYRIVNSNLSHARAGLRKIIRKEIN